ncbi:hypothetical protein C8J57DRAFT_1527261 [Mycena rebaudengoi]|nr:hypothetical protein C8J57DRAFT_1527261 [Mycena rebaudengoi]
MAGPMPNPNILCPNFRCLDLTPLTPRNMPHPAPSIPLPSLTVADDYISMLKYTPV